ncbi:filamentous hemagglutinin N-terminal domain-containing protein [uncultured Phenylobacterium sp.]|uniref:two-partner secretion domain-containing protein n=1 Tax=uncultured Phenylobacterium sp. TaxID=349273 RepID=UPI0025F68C02|nr:filamentous hemagglutinin N-terminal domain-containing protein [uncultured Phenylobacterium sp.]
MIKLTRTRSEPASSHSRFLSRTALCGALYGLQALVPSAVQAQTPPPAAPAPILPTGGIAQVSSGGGAPVITHTSNQMDVTLNAPRTVLSWTGFNVSPDATVNFKFDAKNWIVLNRIVGLSPSKIEGTITGKVGNEFGGNIWFVSNNSIIFGRQSRIDTGGFLAAIGTIDTSSFLDPGNNLFSFSGGDSFAGARLMVLSGGAINGHDGLVAFAGPTIQTRANATVTADGGSVLYGAARNFQIRLAPGTGGNFDLVDFIVPDASAGTDSKVAMDLAAETKAGAVFVAAVSRSAIGSAVINLEGMITATGAGVDGGDIVLSGGGGIAGRGLGAELEGAAPTDMYLNTASAARDLQVRNVGNIFARPWLRPLEEAKDPPTLQEDADAANDTCEARGDCDNGFGNGNGNGFGNGFGNGNGNGFGFLGVELTGPLSTLFDPTAISSISTGRDANIQATASIELGRIVANRDIFVSGPQIEGNSLIAAGSLTATATQGDVALAGIGVGGVGRVTTGAGGDVKIDAISAPQQLTVTSGRDIVLGDGTSAVAGVITLTAGQNVTLDLASAKIDSVTAGVTATLRGGALDIGSVSAPRLLAKAESVRIGTATSSGDIYVVGTNGDAIVGDANAGDDVFVLATHGTASLGSATLGAGPDGVSVAFDGNPDVPGNGKVVRVESVDLDALLGQGTGSIVGATSTTVTAGRDAIVDLAADAPGSFSVVALRDATLRAPTATLDNISAGRDLTFATTSGDLTLTAALIATRNISISSGGALSVADVRADAGSILLSGTTVSAGNVSASEDLTLKATVGGVTTTSFSAGRDLIVQGSTLNLGSSIGPVARDLSITSLGSFTSSGPLSAGRDLTVDVAGAANLGQLTAAGTLRIVAGDLDLNGLATAANAQIEARGGTLRVGGAAGGAGFVFDQNDYGQLRVAGTTRFYAGSTTGSARGDLTLQTLTTNTANTPNLTFLVGSGNNALVQGVVAPSATGGVLRIGDASDLNWRPSSILITGGLGSASVSGGVSYSDIRAYNEVRLAARKDILMGSQRFITLIQGTAIADIDTAAGKPAGVAPTGDETNKVFISAGKLEVSADNKVVQQNTAPLGAGAPVGVFFTGAFTPALIIDPPQIVELWGALAGADGQVIGGAAAGGAVTFQVVDSAGNPTPQPAEARYKFNSCDVGTGNCSAPSVIGGGSSGSDGGGSAEIITSNINAGVLAARDALPGPGGLSDSSNSNDSESSEEAGESEVDSDNVTSGPTLLNVTPPVNADEFVTDPVAAGTGSEEIWRKRRQQK